MRARMTNEEWVDTMPFLQELLAEAKAFETGELRAMTPATCCAQCEMAKDAKQRYVKCRQDMLFAVEDALKRYSGRDIFVDDAMRIMKNGAFDFENIEPQKE